MSSLVAEIEERLELLDADKASGSRPLLRSHPGIRAGEIAGILDPGQAAISLTLTAARDALSLSRAPVVLVDEKERSSSKALLA